MNQRMYLAGYRNGLRLSGFMEARKHNSHRLDEDDPYFVSLGIVDYAIGFEDGWNEQPQKYAGPLEAEYA